MDQLYGKGYFGKDIFFKKLLELHNLQSPSGYQVERCADRHAYNHLREVSALSGMGHGFHVYTGPVHTV